MTKQRPREATTDEPTTARAQAEAAEDAQFLATYDPSRYERLSVAVDVALVTVTDDALRTIVVERTEAPQRGRYGLPGVFVRMDESLDAAAARALSTKVGIEGVFVEQLYTFGALTRDPRTRVVTVAHYALIDAVRTDIAMAGGGCVAATLDVPWEGERGGPVRALDAHGRPLVLAFDHAEILGMVVKRLRGKLDYSPIGFEFLSARFTVADLQRVHEAILGRTLNKDSFRRRMVASGMIAPTGAFQQGVQNRPAELFRFRRAPSS